MFLAYPLGYLWHSKVMRLKPFFIPKSKAWFSSFVFLKMRTKSAPDSKSFGRPSLVHGLATLTLWCVVVFSWANEAEVCSSASVNGDRPTLKLVDWRATDEGGTKYIEPIMPPSRKH